VPRTLRHTKDATHDVYADFAATPDGQLSAAELGAKYDFPASAADAQTELKAIAGEFAVAGAADGLTELLGKYSNQVSAPITTAWGTVTVVGDTGVELERKGWKWPELPDDPFVGTAGQVVNAVTANGFTCTSGGGPHVQNCVRATDLVTAISADDGIHTIGIRAGSWTAARTLQEHIFRALTGSGRSAASAIAVEPRPDGDPAVVQAPYRGRRSVRVRRSGTRSPTGARHRRPPG
jgi:hypothetical protein